MTSLNRIIPEQPLTWILTLSLLIILLPASAQALEVPTFISFQGKLSNSTTGAAYYPASLRMNITNQSQLSQVVWGPYTFNNTADSQGVFDIILGKANQLNLTPGWQYQLVVEADIDATTFTTTDMAFGDLNPAGNSILITGGGPHDATQILMGDNVTTVEAAITSAGTTYTAGANGGLQLTGTEFALTTCTDGQILKNQSGRWECAADATGGGGGLGDSAAWEKMGDYVTLNSSYAHNVNISGGNLTVGGNVGITAGGNIYPTVNSQTAINIANAAMIPFVTFDSTDKRVRIFGGDSVVAPAYLLSLEDDTSLFLNLKSHRDSSATHGNILFEASRGNGSTPLILNTGDEIGAIQFSAYNGSTYPGVAARITVQSTGTVNGSSLPGKMIFSTTSDGAITTTSRMTIDNNGNVGIGTITPQQALHVVGNMNISSGNLYLVNGDVNATGQMCAGSICLAAIGGGGGSAAWEKMGDYATLNSSYAHNVNISGGNLTVAGRVGIGTATPAEQLTVNYSLGVGANDVQYGNIGVYGDSGATSGILNLYNGVTYDDSVDYWQLRGYTLSGNFYISRNGTQDGVFRITAAGNVLVPAGSVGIGTITPQQALHVAGTANITGILYLTNMDVNISLSNIVTNLTNINGSVAKWDATVGYGDWRTPVNNLVTNLTITNATVQAHTVTIGNLVTNLTITNATVQAHTVTIGNLVTNLSITNATVANINGSVAKWDLAVANASLAMAKFGTLTTNNICVGTATGFACSTTGNNGVLVTSATGVPSISNITPPLYVAGQFNATYAALGNAAPSSFPGSLNMTGNITSPSAYFMIRSGGNVIIKLG